jgi:hypothetical protein
MLNATTRARSKAIPVHPDVDHLRRSYGRVTVAYPEVATFEPIDVRAEKVGVIDIPTGWKVELGTVKP